jgi:hypothetical protein
MTGLRHWCPQDSQKHSHASVTGEARWLTLTATTAGQSPNSPELPNPPKVAREFIGGKFLRSR